MNRKIILALVAIMVMGLGVAGFAYKHITANTIAAAVSCCCHGDSCPMKKQATASTTGEKMSCDNCDCCKGDSCPMHKGEHSEKMAAHAEGMPESCPMHNKDAKAEKAVATATAADAKTSCDCSCCDHNKEKKETAAAPAV